MLRRVLIGVAVVVVLIGAWVFRLLWVAGSFTKIEPHFAGEIRLVPGARGPEDLTIHPETGVAYVSASDRWAANQGAPTPGGIYAYDLRDPDAGLVNLTPEAGLEFQPHGISLWRGEDGREALFVVNHPARGGAGPAHTVEIFDVVAGALVHRRRVEDAAHLVTPNDIAAVGPEQFYVTNTHAHPPGGRQTIETYGRLRGARVVYFDGEQFRTAIDHLLFPNGINVSADGRSLYVASTTGREVRVYDREPETEKLTLRRKIFVGPGLDNIEVAADGALWIGAHPKLLMMAAYADDPTLQSPAQVMRVEPDTGRVEEIFLDDGAQLSASSVAAVFEDRLLIGQVFADGILDCTRTP